MNFLQYLNNKCENEILVLGDDLPAVFGAWLSKLDPMELIEYAEVWHHKMLEKEVQDRLNYPKKADSSEEDSFLPSDEDFIDELEDRTVPIEPNPNEDTYFVCVGDGGDRIITNYIGDKGICTMSTNIMRSGNTTSFLLRAIRMGKTEETL